MEDERQWTDGRKMASLRPDFSNAVANVIARLIAQGYPVHIVYASRSLETQKQLLAAGHSKTLNSKHVAEEGEGLAADIVDDRHWWGAGRGQDEAKAMLFFGALGLAAKEEGLTWGGDFVSFVDYAHIEQPD